jgi:hypothetical protein
MERMRLVLKQLLAMPPGMQMINGQAQNIGVILLLSLQKDALE